MMRYNTFCINFSQAYQDLCYSLQCFVVTVASVVVNIHVLVKLILTILSCRFFFFRGFTSSCVSYVGVCLVYLL